MKFFRRLALIAAIPLSVAPAALTMSPPAFAQAVEKPELAPMRRVPEARAGQSAKGEDDRVFGGGMADKDEWPFQVALLTSERLDDSPDSQADAQFCGGSLIAPGWVLTAAHCLSQDGGPVSPDSVTVLVGATNLKEGVRYKVASVFVHEGYSTRTLDNDVGLLELSSDADAPTIRLPDAPTGASGTATVIGWGMMKDGTFPNDLMEADLDIVDNAACNAGIKQIYERDLGRILRNWAPRMHYSDEAVAEATAAIVANMADPLTGNMICAGTESGARDACNGDSGGPLLTKGDGGATQIGIVSWGEGPLDEGAACGHQNAYGVYTRLANYTGWIAGKMNGGKAEGEGKITTSGGMGTVQKP